MTFKIAKSIADTFPNFEPMVAAYAAELRHWRAHMKRVAEDEARGAPAAERHMAYPRPDTHQTIMAAVNENDEADYQIVDDGPTPAQILAAKKGDLAHLVSVAEAAAIAAVVPVRKQRLFNLRENDIRAADSKIAQDIEKPGLLASAASAIGLSSPVDIAAEIERQRPAADTQHLNDQADRRRKINAIERAAAQMHADIEDLTVETIDAWQIPNLG
jgi:hypothetical protein